MKIISYLKSSLSYFIKTTLCIIILYNAGYLCPVFEYIKLFENVNASYITDKNLANYNTKAGFYFQYKPSAVACAVGEGLYYSDDANGDLTTGDYGWICESSSSYDGHSLDSADGSIVDVVFVNSTGDVGIGTTIPSSKLDIEGDLDLNDNELLNARIQNLSIAPTCTSNEAGELYFNSLNNQTYVCNGTVFIRIDAVLAASDLSAIQVRRTTTFSLAALNTWYDIAFDATDIENNNLVLEHNNTNTERIDIKDSGVYRITYHVQATDTGATHTINTRVQTNGTTVLNGSLIGETNYQGEHGTVTGTFLANLSVNDYITLQVERTSANGVIGETLLTITKLEGPKGDSGTSGTAGVDGTDGVDGLPGGTTVDIQKDDITVVSDVDVINFEGGITVTDNGSKKVTIDVSGGSSTANVFYAYDGTGGSDVTQTATIVNVDTTVVSDSNYTLASDIVTINQTGLYKVSARITVEANGTSGTQRASIKFRAQKALGSGSFSDLSGALCQEYMREQASANSVSASCSITFFESFNANDRLQFQKQALTTTTSETVAEGSAVTIEFIR